MKSIATSRKPEFPEEYPEMKQKMAEAARRKKEDEEREARYNEWKNKKKDNSARGKQLWKSDGDVCFLCERPLTGEMGFMYSNEKICKECHNEVYSGRGWYD